MGCFGVHLHTNTQNKWGFVVVVCCCCCVFPVFVFSALEIKVKIGAQVLLQLILSCGFSEM